MRSRPSGKLPLLLLAPLWACAAGGEAARPAEPALPPPPLVLPHSDWSQSKQAVHVLNRLAFGPSPQDLRDVQQLGVAAWIQRQLSPASLPDDAVDQKLAGLRTLTLSTEELERDFPPLNEQAKEMGVDLKEEGARQQLRERIGPDALPGASARSWRPPS
jgi:Protein of unknown function (DUF1800)